MFTRHKVRILKLAMTDTAYALLDHRADIDMLLAFLDRFDHLGWLPPIDNQKRKLLAANDVSFHVFGKNRCYYEFCSRGARGERRPWLSIFFHVDRNRIVRIIGIVRAQELERRPSLQLEIMRIRVIKLEDWLQRQS